MNRVPSTSVTSDYCKHDDVCIDADTNHYFIECHQCGRWWDCYGQFAVVWADFVKYNRMDEGEPPTVNIVGPLKALPTSDKKMVLAT